MRIAHIAPPWLPIPPKNYGGTENVLHSLIEKQVSLGHDVTLIAPGDAKTSAKLVSFFPQSLLATGVPWASPLKAYYHFYKAIEYVKEHDFDIVHAHLSSSPDMFIFPLIASLSVPHVMTLHSNFPFDRVEPWIGDADTLYMEWASLVPMIAISEHARDTQVYPLNFVGVVYNGLPMALFQPTVKQPEDFFVWLGHFAPQKGPHLAIEAAKKAGVQLVLAGIINSSTPELVRYFEEVIKPQIDNQQIMYIGPVNMQQKIDLLSRARGFLNPIQWEEPFGMVMIEAMAVGCPVISFARGAAPELVVHRKTGFLAHNREEMIYFISRIGEINRQVTRLHVAQNFSDDVMAEKYIKIYNKVMSITCEDFSPSQTVRSPHKLPSFSSHAPTDYPVELARRNRLAADTPALAAAETEVAGCCME